MLNCKVLGGFAAQPHWGNSEHAPNPPAPFPHICFATVWGLGVAMTQPVQNWYAQKSPSHSSVCVFRRKWPTG